MGEFVLPLNIPAPPGGTGTLKYDDFTFAAAGWTLTAHEGRPGHEMQFASIIERGVSTTRVLFAFNSTNVEGWGLYAEQLGGLMAEQVLWPVGIAFYALYVVGILVFAVLPGLEDNSLKTTLLRAGLTVVGDVATNTRYFLRAMRWVEYRKVLAEPMVSCRFALDQAKEAFDAFSEGGAVKVLFEM